MHLTTSLTCSYFYWYQVTEKSVLCIRNFFKTILIIIRFKTAFKKDTIAISIIHNIIHNSKKYSVFCYINKL